MACEIKLYIVLDFVSHSGIGKVASRGAATTVTSH